MGLVEQIKRDEEELAKLEAEAAGDKPAAETATEQTETQAEPEPEAAETETTGDETAEPEKTEAETAEETDEKPDAAAFAKARREKRELQAKIDELRQQLQQVQQPAQRQAETSAAKADPDPEPSKQDNYEAWLEWKDRQLERKTAQLEQKLNEREQREYVSNLYTAALQELQDDETTYKRAKPDYDAAMEHMKTAYVNAMRMVNPGVTGKEVNSAMQQSILKLAATAKARGVNPAEALYDAAIEFYGYQPGQATEAKPAAKPAPNLGKIAANQRRSASPLQGGGSGQSAMLTMEMVANMSNAEFMKLTPAQLRQLEMQAQ